MKRKHETKDVLSSTLGFLKLEGPSVKKAESNECERINSKNEFT